MKSFFLLKQTPEGSCRPLTSALGLLASLLTLFAVTCDPIPTRADDPPPPAPVTPSEQTPASNPMALANVPYVNALHRTSTNLTALVHAELTNELARVEANIPPPFTLPTNLATTSQVNQAIFDAGHVSTNGADMAQGAVLSFPSSNPASPITPHSSLSSTYMGVANDCTGSYLLWNAYYIESKAQAYSNMYYGLNSTMEQFSSGRGVVSRFPGSRLLDRAPSPTGYLTVDLATLTDISDFDTDVLSPRGYLHPNEQGVIMFPGGVNYLDNGSFSSSGGLLNLYSGYIQDPYGNTLLDYKNTALVRPTPFPPTKFLDWTAQTFYQDDGLTPLLTLTNNFITVPSFPHLLDSTSQSLPDYITSLHPSTPTLQDVTGSGNSTSHPIQLGANTSLYDGYILYNEAPSLVFGAGTVYWENEEAINYGARYLSYSHRTPAYNWANQTFHAPNGQVLLDLRGEGGLIHLHPQHEDPHPLKGVTIGGTTLYDLLPVVPAPQDLTSVLSVGSISPGGMTLGSRPATPAPPLRGWGSLEVGEEVVTAGSKSLALGDSILTTGDRSLAAGHLLDSSAANTITLGYYASTTNENSFVWSGGNFTGGVEKYSSHGPGTFSINPSNGPEGFYIGTTNLRDHITALAPLPPTPTLHEVVGDVSEIPATIGGLSISDTALAWTGDSITFGEGSFAQGQDTRAAGDFSHAEGCGTHAEGECSHAEGLDTVAAGDFSHAEGFGARAEGVYSHAEGDTTIAFEEGSHAEGFGTWAEGVYSHAEGLETIAVGYGSHAEGYGTYAAGYGSHAEGCGTHAEGECSHAEGLDTVAAGDFSHAEGLETTAVGYGSHAEGYGTHAAGYGSHAEGLDTVAAGDFSHAEGCGTRAAGDFSHAEGYGTHAIDPYSWAWSGGGSQATYSSHGSGTFNINPDAGAAGVYIGEDTLVKVIQDNVPVPAFTPSTHAVAVQNLKVFRISLATSKELTLDFTSLPSTALQDGPVRWETWITLVDTNVVLTLPSTNQVQYLDEIVTATTSTNETIQISWQAWRQPLGTNIVIQAHSYGRGVW